MVPFTASRIFLNQHLYETGIVQRICSPVFNPHPATIVFIHNPAILVKINTMTGVSSWIKF